MGNNWISVEDELPLDRWRGTDTTCVIGDFLVTVELDRKDPEDDPEVLILTYDLRNEAWVTPLQMRPYDWGWHVTHWQEKPRPAGWRK